MIKSYEEFIASLNKHITNNQHFVYELLVTVIQNPERYTGIFRLSNAKTKLIQNVTQSREIKFGDFMEEIVTEYISHMGYKNLDKKIGTDDSGNALNADQVFINNNTVFLIEQKMRDDHDSTKKRGQYENFKKKYYLLKNTYPNYNIDATMWFIDDNLTKNRKYYLERASQETDPNINVHIYYGKSLFEELFNRTDVWDEICSYLLRNKQERSNELLYIPDFDTSIEVKEAINILKIQEPQLYRKLISDKPKYIQLRKELFPSGQNLK